MQSNVSSQPRFLSLWLERFSTDRIARQWHEASAADALPRPARGKQAPALVVFGKRGNLDLLVAVDAQAERPGLHPGLALAQARAMHPALTAVPEDQAADASLLDTIADWCQRYTPLLAVDPPDGILLDIGGCAHLFGGEARLCDDFVRRVTGFGFAARAAIAGTIGAAWAAARFGDAGIITTEEERDALAPLPLAALRLPDETVAALARVGLKRIEDILDLPRAPLTARFGAELLFALDRALGRERKPLTPRLPIAPYVAERSFHEPIAREEDVLATVERLAMRLRTALAARGDGARRLELALFRADGVVKRIAAGTSRPVRDPQAVRALFVERMAALGDELDPGFGFDLVRLSVLVAEPRPDEQIGLGDREENVELDRLVDRLSARLGRRRVTRLVAHDSHIPELAATAAPAQSTARADEPASGEYHQRVHARLPTRYARALLKGPRWPLASLASAAGVELGWQALRRFRTETGASPRPLRLLAKPEPIEAIAVVPDGPPLRFRWRRALHEIVAAEGPERIEGVWWNEQGSPARADEPGECPARALMEWPRWPLASLASAARADEPASDEYHQRVHARLPTRYARALIESPRWPLASLASAARDYFRVEDKRGLRFWLFRCGLYRDIPHGHATPSWFLHGMYA